MFRNVKVVAFDADDTLWVNEPIFKKAHQDFAEIVSQWIGFDEIPAELYKTEVRNIPIYGFGIKGFILSMIETSIRVSQGEISAAQIGDIIGIGKGMQRHPVELLPEVEDTLETLSARYRLIVATKGDLIEQQRKLRESNLEKYFHHVEVMSDKTPDYYRKLIKHLDIETEDFLMIGNSIRSDILPVLEIGGHAIHVPYHLNWIHEQVDDFDTNRPRFMECERLKEVIRHLLPAEVSQ